MKILLIAFLIYLAFQFIFRLVIPVYIASRKIKKGFREMQSHMSEQAENPYSQQEKPHRRPAYPSAASPDAGDYIEFEELK